MSNFKPSHQVLKNPVTTWLTDTDFEAVKRIAARHGVPASTYLRAVLADVISEESEEKPAKLGLVK